MENSTAAPSCPKASKRRGSRVVAMLLALPLVILAAEVVLRFTQRIPGPGWKARAGQPWTVRRVQSSPDGLDEEHRYNNLGLRGPRVEVRRQTRYRVVCVGDSYTEGHGAAEGGTWPARAQESLDSDTWEFVNAGVLGESPAGYAHTVASIGLAIEPTHVVVCFSPQDFFTTVDLPDELEVADECVDPFRSGRGGPMRFAVAALPGWSYLVDRLCGLWKPRVSGGVALFDDRIRSWTVSQLMRRESVSRKRATELLEERLALIDPKVRAAMDGYTFNAWTVAGAIAKPYVSYAVRLDDMDSTRDELDASIGEWTRWFASACRERGAHPIVLFIPHAPQVHAGPWGPMGVKDLESSPMVEGDTSVSRWLADACQAAGVAFLDAMPVLREHDDEPLYLRYDTHPNERGYEVVGRWVAKRLVELAGD